MKEKEKPSFKDNLSNFIQKYKIAILVVIGVSLISALSFALYLEIDKGHQVEVAKNYQKNLKLFEEWKVSEPNDNKDVLESSFIQSIETDINSITQGFVSQKLHLLMADYYKEKNDSVKRAEQYQIALQSSPSSSFNAGILFLLADTQEQNKDLISAKKSLQEILEMQNSEAILLHPLVWLSIARIEEQQLNTEEALKAYTMILDNYPDNDLSKFARTRVIALNL